VGRGAVTVAPGVSLLLVELIIFDFNMSILAPIDKSRYSAGFEGAGGIVRAVLCVGLVSHESAADADADDKAAGLVNAVGARAGAGACAGWIGGVGHTKVVFDAGAVVGPLK